MKRYIAASLAAIGSALAGCADGSTTAAGASVSVEESLVVVSAQQVAAGDSLTVTLEARDGSGAPVGATGLQVEFFTIGGEEASAGTLSGASPAGPGVYRAAFVGTRAGSPVAIGARVDGRPVNSQLPLVSVTAGTVSGTRSFVSAERDVMVLGGGSTLTLHAFDDFGNVVDVSASSVTFALEPGPGLSGGTLAPAERVGRGRIAARFTATQAGAHAQVLAAVDGRPVSNAPALTVVGELGSALHSTLEVSAVTLVPGGTATVSLQVRDGVGTPTSAGGLDVSFAMDQGEGLSRGSLTETQDAGNGTYLSQFTAESVGAPVALYAAVNGVAVGGAPPTIEVVLPPESPQRAVLTVSRDTVAAGELAEFRLQMKDSGGEDLARSGLAVEFEVSGPSGGDIGDVVDHGDGSYTSSFLARTAGSESTVVYRVDSVPFERAEAKIVVVPGPLSVDSSTVLINGKTADSVFIGDTAIVQAAMTDAFGNRVAGGDQVSFSLERPALGDIGPVADDGNGTYTAQLVGKTPGPPSSVTARVAGQPGQSRAAQVAVVDRSWGVSADSSFITVAGLDSITIEAGISVTVELQAVDSIGRVLHVGGHGVAFSLETGDSLSTGVLSAVTDRLDGTYSADFVAVRKGRSAAIVGTVGGDSVTSALPIVRVVPGDISAMMSTLSIEDSLVVVGDSTTVTLTSIDAFGNKLESGGLAVAFEVVAGDSLSVATVGSTVDHGDGIYSAVLVGSGVGLPTRVRAWIGGTRVIENDAGVEVVPQS